MAKEPKVEPKIVEASGSASSSMAAGNKSLAQSIEQAMTEETQKCFDEGVTAPEEIRERKLAARERVKDEAAAEAATAADAAKE